MKRKQHFENSQALTLIEVIVVIAILGVFAALLIPALHHSQPPAYRIRCVSNLKQVGLAFRLFSTDHDDKFPMLISTNDGGSLEFVGTGETWRHFQVLSNEFSVPKILVCPIDDRTEATDFESFGGNQHTSYFVGLDTMETTPGMFLSGDRNLMIDGRDAPGVYTITQNSQLGWTEELHKENGNIALGDGSVQQFTSPSMQEHLEKLGDVTNRFSIP